MEQKNPFWEVGVKSVVIFFNKSISRDNELIDEDNTNSNSRLWVQSDCTIYKEYNTDDILTEKNIVNIEDFSHGWKKIILSKIKELTLPQEIVVDKESRIIGYTMKYYSDACVLSDYLANDSIRNSMKLDVFVQLAEVIKRMPYGVFIGDLHEKNVLVDGKGKIHLIDIDGFSQIHNQMTCPMEYYLSGTTMKKYMHGDTLKISKNTDIFCYCCMLVEWISGIRMIQQFTQKEIYDYLKWIFDVSRNKKLVDMIRRLYEPKKNYISLTAIKRINANFIEKYSYMEYLKSID